MNRLTLEELDRFAQELASLSRSGIPLPEGVEMLAATVSPRAVQQLAAALVPRLKQGQSLSEALAASNPKLPQEFIALVQCGEKTGDLRPVLDHATTTSRLLRRHHETVYTTMFYPLLVICVAACVVMLIANSILPQFQDIFRQLGAELPWLTRMFMDLGEFARGDIGFLLLGGILAMVAALALSVPLRERVVGAASALPMFRDLTLLCDTAAAMRYISLMLGHGAPLAAALSSASLAVTYRPFAKNLSDMAEAAERGQPVAPLLGGYMPSTAAYLFVRGEREGRLAEACGGIADYCQGRFDRLGRRSLLILEPIVILIVALFVGFLAVSLYLPMFSIPKIVGR